MGPWGKWVAAALVVCSAQAAAQTPAPSVSDQTKPASAQSSSGASHLAPAQADTDNKAPAKAAENKAEQAPGPTPRTASHPPTAEDICHAVEHSAGEYELPVEFFARVIWQESRFNARAISPKGAEGIAQFMPATADFRGLADPFDPIAALHKAAGYLADLRKQFGNLGLAAAGYNAGPGRVSAWLAGQGALPSETRHYVAVTTGRSADEWASAEPPQEAEKAMPHGLPCTALANLIVPKLREDEPDASAPRLPRWGMQLAANWSEDLAWASYRRMERQYASVIGGREPIVVKTRAYGMGTAMRYAIRISGDDFSALQKLCNKLVTAGGACVVLPNGR
jgi:soluble lytic murein transglycosylase-like protein